MSQSTRLCARCHVAPRNSTNKSYCVSCQRIKAQEAREKHRQRESEKPCARCGVAPRNSSCPSYCLDCNRAIAQEFRERHGKRSLKENCTRCGNERTGGHHAYCLDCCRAQRQEWLSKNKTEKPCARCGTTPRLAHMSYCRPCHRSLGKESFERRGGKKIQTICVRCGESRDGSHPTYCAKCWRYWQVMRNYDLTTEQYDQMAAGMNGQCPLCLSAPGVRGWHVDHCHITGKVRGLLCGSCNRGLGQLQDNPEILRRAADYLEAARK